MRNSLVEAAAMKRQFEQLRTAHERDDGRTGMSAESPSHTVKRGTKRPHGTPGRYSYGCRCGFCREAWAKYTLEKKQERVARRAGAR